MSAQLRSTNPYRAMLIVIIHVPVPVLEGHSPSRRFKLSEIPMLYDILALSGLTTMFFSHDGSVMSQINTNPDYLTKMGTNNGIPRDAAAIGSVVSVCFGGFATAVGPLLILLGDLTVGMYADKIRRLKRVQIGCIRALLGAALQVSAQNIT
jgi:hypothetical protein